MTINLIGKQNDKREGKYSAKQNNTTRQAQCLVRPWGGGPPVFKKMTKTWKSRLVNRCQWRRQCRQWRPRNRRPTTTTTYNFFRRIDFLCRIFFRSIFFRPKGQGPGFNKRRTTHDERRTTNDASKLQPFTKKKDFPIHVYLALASQDKTDGRTHGRMAGRTGWT